MSQELCTKNLLTAIVRYVEGAIWKLKYQLGSIGETLKDELNVVCHAHTITLLAADVASYNGCDIVDGVLRLLFGPTYLGTNIDQCLDSLPEVINKAPQPAGAPSLSFASRHAIKADYAANVDSMLEKARKLLENSDLKFEPGFEENSKLLQGGKDVRDDWETNLGRFTLGYFESFVDKLQYEKFGDDDMLREGFAEAVSTSVVKFSIVEKMDGYNGVKVENEAFVMQTTPGYFGTNISQTCEKLVDVL